MDEARDRHLIEAVVLAALGRRRRLADRLKRARTDGVAANVLREALLQVLPYAGFPRALSALVVFADLDGTGDATVESARSREDLRRRGERTFRAVHGGAADGILERIGRAHPELPSWILEDAYGKVLARPGLTLADREVLGVALLTALDQPDQLHGHIRGGIRAGAAPERLRAAIEITARHIGPGAADRARERLRRELT